MEPSNMTTDALVELTDAQTKPKPEMAAPKIANVDGRLGTALKNRIVSLVGLPWKRRLASAALLIPQIRHYESLYLTQNDEDLRLASTRLRGQARGGANLDKLIPEAFGLSSVAIRRIHGYQPFDVQLAAGIVMHYGGLVELATGEGKTLSAVGPAFLECAAWQGCSRYDGQRLFGST